MGKDHKEHPHSAVPRPPLEDAGDYEVEIDSHEPDALEGDAFPATIHAVNVEKGTVTVSYEVDDGAPPDYQEMDYHSKDIAWIKAPRKVEAKPEPEPKPAEAKPEETVKANYHFAEMKKAILD